MFDHTKEVVGGTVRGLKKFFFCVTIFMQLLYIGYLAHAIFAEVGNLYANIVLCAISVIYLIAGIIIHNITGKEGKRYKKLSKRAYKWGKLLINAFTLGVAIYGLVNSAGSNNLLSIVLTVFMIISWCFKVFVQILIICIERKKKQFIEIFKKEKDEIVQPVQKEQIPESSAENTTQVEDFNEKSNVSKFLEKTLGNFYHREQNEQDNKPTLKDKILDKFKKIK